jgi:copper chaperone NosL
MIPRTPIRRGVTPVFVLLALFVPLLAGGCDGGPRAIQVGAEECAHCRMLVSENRFAAQLVTDRGRSYVFDSIECMAEFLDEAVEVPEDRVRSLWVTDFSEPGQWLDVGEAHFLRSEELRSPMGLNLSAHAAQAGAREHREAFGGELLTWTEVRALVAGTPVRGGGGHSLGHPPGPSHESGGSHGH